MTTMRAAQYDAYGDPEVLYETVIRAPTPRPGEVLVKVHAASVNGIDLIVRAGVLRMVTGQSFPIGTGLDFAGDIMSLGHEASGLRVGDKVWGAMPHGNYGSAAEYVCVRPKQLSLFPPHLSYVEAAALPAVGATAIIALRDIGRLEDGQKLLVRGASGGVGSVAIQLGRAVGAHVTGLASTGNLEFVMQLGAHAALDYAKTRPADLGPFDVILDTVGSHAADYRKLLTRQGRMMSLCPDPQRPVRSMLYMVLSAIHGRRRVRFFSAKPQRTLLEDLATYVDQGAIRPIINEVFALQDIAQAHRAMERSGRRGKQIIRIT